MQPELVISDRENSAITMALLCIELSPYAEPTAFDSLIRSLVDDVVPARIREFVEHQRTRSWSSNPVLRVANCPIDPNLPFLDPVNPVTSKYAKKSTNVAEGWLALWAILTGTEIISHRSVNAGDRFHDIHPKASLYDSQSQKTLGTLRLHRDFTNHFVSPDFVTTLVLRDGGDNDVVSTFVFAHDALARLDRSTLRVLREPRFHTPFDDISVKESSVLNTDASTHPLLVGECSLRVFEGRTRGLDPEATSALETVISTMHATKREIRPGPGELVHFANDCVIHGREVREIRDLAALNNRWLMKTHNVWSLREHEAFFEREAYGVVDG